MSGELAQVDLLTGAFRRPIFEELLARAVRAARKSGLPLSLLYLDADELQEHNDSHGRDRVDAAISHLASQISELMDGKGPIGRLAGGAFAVLLPGTGLNEARELGERIRTRAPSQVHSSAFGDFRLHVSVGAAELRSLEASGNLLEAAEQACLHAKQGGRDLLVSR